MDTPYLPPIERPKGLMMKLVYAMTKRRFGRVLTRLTRDKRVTPQEFQRLAEHYSDREICEIVWLVASEHVYNIANIGLNIHSDGLCRVDARASSTAA